MNPVLTALAFLSTQELIIVLIIVLLLFGSSRIPSLMRSMGQGVGEFKKGIKDGNEPDKPEPPKAEPPAPPAAH